MEFDGVLFPYPMLIYRTDIGMFELLQDFITPEYRVPAGTLTDGASVPDFLEPYVRKFDKHLPAAIVHDWMYANGIATRAEADKLFEKNLWRCHYAYGFPSSKITPMVQAVRTFGGKYYNAKQKETK